MFLIVIEFKDHSVVAVRATKDECLQFFDAWRDERPKEALIYHKGTLEVIH